MRDLYNMYRGLGMRHLVVEDDDRKVAGIITYHELSEHNLELVIENIHHAMDFDEKGDPRPEHMGSILFFLFEIEGWPYNPPYCTVRSTPFPFAQFFCFVWIERSTFELPPTGLEVRPHRTVHMHGPQLFSFKKEKKKNERAHMTNALFEQRLAFLKNDDYLLDTSGNRYTKALKDHLKKQQSQGSTGFHLSGGGRPVLRHRHDPTNDSTQKLFGTMTDAYEPPPSHPVISTVQVSDEHDKVFRTIDVGGGGDGDGDGDDDGQGVEYYEVGDASRSSVKDRAKFPKIATFEPDIGKEEDHGDGDE